MDAITGLYIHFPFCASKCAYCDFGSVTGQEHLFAPYLDGLGRELARRAEAWRGTPFGSIYLGGGTPSLMPAHELAALINACGAALSVTPDVEITIEANPGTVSLAGLEVLLQAGVNRLSLGVQSLNDDELALLGRGHSAEMAAAAYQMGRQVGLENISLDLIFGLPRQSLADWIETLDHAIDLTPEHLSLYCLTLEEDTPLATAVALGQMTAPDEDASAEMYETSTRRLGAAGYAHYEISNWAKSDSPSDPLTIPALASRHNLVYWRNGRYLGLGAGAYSYDGITRSGNVADPAEYIERMATECDAIATSESLSPLEQLGETMMLGLRLTRGIAWTEIEARFAVDGRVLYAAQIDELATEGLILVDEMGLRLSQRGRLLGNRVFAAFLDSSA